MMSMNSRQMQQAMRRLGVQQVEIDATEVIIRTAEKELVFHKPAVAKINMMGQESFQVVGTPIERSVDTAPSISHADIETVAEQAGCSHEAAEQAVRNANGDLAEAILKLRK